VTYVLTITEKAAAALKEIPARQENSADLMLRVSFGGFG
jgi:Fe-S cluster assembly iron-binding protein IscA